MDSDEGVLLPIHQHPMVPFNDLRSGSCCGGHERLSDGFYCKRAIFLHTRNVVKRCCNLCGKDIKNIFYRCKTCDLDIDLHCASYLPADVIHVSEKTHPHKLTLAKEQNWFNCAANCGKIGVDEFPYKCYECDLAFHVDCLTYPLEVNHFYHSLHPLKLLTGQPGEYSDGRCRLCEKKIDEKIFYHCSSSHDHQLTLLPRLDSFTCNACGLKGDQSPYICVQCGFMIHQGCICLPRVININRHDHRISRTSLLGLVNSVCGVCHHKVDWTCGGFSCQRCPGYVVHSKCATRRDVWNGIELEDVPDETEDTEPYVVIDDNTKQHFSHKEHHLKLNANGILWEEKKHCKACAHPIGLQSFYGCIMYCDFVIHQICAGFPRKKWHVLHNERLTLVTSKEADYFNCDACGRMSNGFRYKHGDKQLDVLCGSISEPFVHPSHPHHPLYYTSSNEKRKCNGCKVWRSPALMCIEEVVKHRVDDHPLSLCYGEEANGKYWCDICEKETNSETWFYTCKDHRASLHINCVFGDFTGLMPRSTIEFWNTSFEVVLNNNITRPVCEGCESRSIYPINLKVLRTSNTYFALLIAEFF
ncbi:hypothetical protein EUTSA_v10028534mg [Eutrema salsugineum]|uniref:Phorbol-ester/DAG-type domain-containing protein n=1 Tax=Eutrema salsugineum TaxID=72664 RepID=V4L7L5_EUTSA|nr:hypothetical protein EUTSA_v10028534mg [Eutrema salsugineum]